MQARNWNYTILLALCLRWRNATDAVLCKFLSNISSLLLSYCKMCTRTTCSSDFFLSFAQLGTIFSFQFATRKCKTLSLCAQNKHLIYFYFYSIEEIINLHQLTKYLTQFIINVCFYFLKVQQMRFC